MYITVLVFILLYFIFIYSAFIAASMSINLPFSSVQQEQGKYRVNIPTMAEKKRTINTVLSRLSKCHVNTLQI